MDGADEKRKVGDSMIIEDCRFNSSKDKSSAQE